MQERQRRGTTAMSYAQKPNGSLNHKAMSHKMYSVAQFNVLRIGLTGTLRFLTAFEWSKQPTNQSR